MAEYDRVASLGLAVVEFQSLEHIFMPQFYHQLLNWNLKLAQNEAHALRALFDQGYSDPKYKSPYVCLAIHLFILRMIFKSICL